MNLILEVDDKIIYNICLLSLQLN